MVTLLPLLRLNIKRVRKYRVIYSSFFFYIFSAYCLRLTLSFPPPPLPPLPPVGPFPRSSRVFLHRVKLARLHVAAIRDALREFEGGSGSAPADDDDDGKQRQQQQQPGVVVAGWLPSYGTDPYYPSKRIRRITERVYYQATIYIHTSTTVDHTRYYILLGRKDKTYLDHSVSQKKTTNR